MIENGEVRDGIVDAGEHNRAYGRLVVANKLLSV